MIRFFVLMALIVLCAPSCKGGGGAPGEGAGKKIFEDHFDGKTLADHWLDTSKGKYSIIDGRLRVQGAHNKPLWLEKKLPRDVRVEFTARSVSDAVDIKVELFGDGESFAKQASYTATSYVFVLGGWNNSRSIIARMNEHGDDRKERRKPSGEVGKDYRFSITRKGNLVAWDLDGESFLKFDDPEPLAGPGHEHFAINNWESEVYLDDLVIYEL